MEYLNRVETDHRTFGDLFYACCQEQADISSIEALHRIMSLAVQRIRQAESYCEKTASEFFRCCNGNYFEMFKNIKEQGYGYPITPKVES